MFYLFLPSRRLLMSCCVDVSRARKSFPPLRMASELTKTEISTMRVKNLREELQSRGLDTAGARPLLQDRLREGCCSKKNLNAPKPSCCCFSHSAYWLPTRKKLLYTVANLARGLLNRGKTKQKNSPPLPFPLSLPPSLSLSLYVVCMCVCMCMCVCVYLLNCT